MEFANKVVLITGPGKGMGAAITKAFAREGAILALAGRDTAAIEPVAAEVTERGVTARVYGTDLSSDAAIRTMVDRVVADFGGRIDALVNVAGVRGPFNKTLWEHSEEEYDVVMDVNVRGLWLTMKYVVPVMIKQRSGSVVHIGGTYGITGKDYRSIYSTSKWALRGLTKSAALEAGPYGIRVNVVCPAASKDHVSSVMNATAERLSRTYDEVRGIYESNCALRRIATDEDIADATLFMASERARNITGQELVVDAGSVLMPYPPSVPPR